MIGKTLLLTVPLLALSLAGCLGDSGADSLPTGTLALGLMDDGAPAQLTFEGIWGLHNDTTSWRTIVDANATWNLTGSGSEVTVAGDAAAGRYEGIRVAFTSVSESGSELIMTRSGFDLPLDFTVQADEETHIGLRFSWGDALFDSQQGRAFTPALKAVRVFEAGIETVALEAQEIRLGDTKPPVARMRVFDETGLQVFESDFVAESPLDPAIANGGNITFAASESEALHPGSEIESYRWEFDDGTVMEGSTVEYPFEEGRNHTVRLVVTDSQGVEDFQALTIAVKPPVFRTELPVSGTLSGAFGSQAGLSACGTQPGPLEGTSYVDFLLPVDPFMLPDGTPALGLVRVESVVDVSGVNPESSIGVITADANGTQIHGASNPNFPGYGGRSYSTDYPPGANSTALPAAGEWTMRVYSCSTLNQPFEGYLGLTWIVGDPGYSLWVNAFEDGHDHQH